MDANVSPGSGPSPPRSCSARPADGRYRVERLSGLLLPGFGKTFAGDRGVTTLAGRPLAQFGVAGRSLIYDWLPVRDRLERDPQGGWTGSGIVAGVVFCRFRLVPQDDPPEAGRLFPSP